MLKIDLSGQQVCVTGGATGIGFAIARCMTEAGARVLLVGRREEVLKSAVAALPEGTAEYLTLDISTIGDDESVRESIRDLMGGLSVLVNNAGVHSKLPLAETSTAEFERVLATHLSGSLAMCRVAEPLMQKAGGGSIVNISSMTAFIGMPMVVSYSSAKAGVLGMTRSLAAELADRNIRVNAIAPGWIETPMLRQALAGDAAREAKILARTPMGRFGVPEDIGRLAAFLSSPLAQFITGTAIPVDGGALTGF